jgi:hypothetical protein
MSISHSKRKNIMTAYASPNFDTLLNAENSASAFIGYFDTDTDNAGIGSTGSQPPNLPGSNPQGKILPAAEAYAAQSQQRPKEQLDQAKGTLENRVDALEIGQASLTHDLAALTKTVNDGFAKINNEMVTKEGLNQTINALRNEMVTKDDMRELLNKKVEEQVIDGKSP